MALTKVTGQIIKDTTDVTVGVLTVTNTLAVGGTVSIGGTLTYEDVTNVDAVGLITARNGIVVGSGITLSKDGDIFATGIVTATSFVGDGAVTINENGTSRIVTGSSFANTLNAKSNLIFDNTSFLVGSGVTISKDGHVFTTGVSTIGTLSVSGIATVGGVIDSSTGTITASGDMTAGGSLTVNGGGGLTLSTGNVTIPNSIIHNGDTDTKIRFPAADTVTVETGGSERFRIASNGRVGISTDDPQARLDVRDTSGLGIISRSASTQATDGNKALKVRNNSTTDTFSVSYKGLTEIRRGEIGTYLKVGGDDADNGRALTFTSSTNESVGALHTLDAVSGNGEIALATAGSERMRVTQDGKVGVNSTSPAAKLDVVARGDTEIGIRLTDSNDAEEAPYIEVIGRRADGNSSQCFSGKLHLARNRTDQKVSANNMLGAVAFGGNHTDGDPSNILYTASIGAIAGDNFDSSTDMPTDLVFMAGSTGRTPTAVNVSIGAERLRIKDAGDLQVRRDGNGDVFRYYRAGTSLFVIDNLLL